MLKAEELKSNLARLRMQCRRGMLELDLMLNTYLEQAYPDSSAAKQAAFESLLACTDQQLFEWFMGRGLPEDPTHQDIILVMRHLCNHTQCEPTT